MSEPSKPGRGALFKNDRKREGRSDPDYNGTITLPSGAVHFLDAWIETSAKGLRYLSVKIGNEKQQQAPAPSVADKPLDDDIPF